MATSEKYFAKLAPNQKKIASCLKKIIMGSAPGVEEGLKWGQLCYSKGGNFCYLKAAKDHVTLGFFKGAKLKTAKHLDGGGSLLRHIKFSNASEIDSAMLKKIIKEAISLNI